MCKFVCLCVCAFSPGQDVHYGAEVRMMTVVIKIKSRQKDTDQTSLRGSVCACMCGTNMCLYTLCVCVSSVPCCLRPHIPPPKGHVLERPRFKVPQNLQNRGVCDFCLVSTAVNWSCSRLSSGYWEVCMNV